MGDYSNGVAARSGVSPGIGTRVRRAVVNGAKLIVIDPFRISIAKYASLYLQARPGSNIPLLLGIARLIIDHRWHDESFIRERCENFEAFSGRARMFPIREP